MNPNYDTDVVIVGSGIAGGVIAFELSQAGAKVIVLEAGPRLKRAEIVANFRNSARRDDMAPYPFTKHAPHPESNSPESYLIQSGSHPFETQYIRAVGGTTWHWAAASWRFLPNDFQLKSKYGVGRDWPFQYHHLEPYYCKAEKALGVAGDSSNELGSPRSKPYPMKPIPLSYMDQQFQKVLSVSGYDLVVEPVARNSEPYDGRPACCGNNNCMPICPIGAQYSADIHISRAEKAGIQLIENAVAHFIEADGTGKIRSIHYKTPDGQNHIVRGKIFVLAANGIETPKLLLLSRTHRFPQGLANTSDQLGRNLMDHPGVVMNFLMPRPVFPGRGPQEITSIVNFRDGEFRKTMSAKKLHFANTVDTLGITNRLIELGIRGKDLNSKIRDIAIRRCSVSSFHEQLPFSHNRISLHKVKTDALGIPRPEIQYSLEDEYLNTSTKLTREMYSRIAKLLGATEIEHVPGLQPNSHIMGTTIMGEDPKTSVVNKFCRTHGHKNLFIAGSSVFASSAAVNPTLTIAALSLMISEKILDELALQDYR